ncbi:uncharacterized protein LOC127534524 [Acanthochromis polyacanthus]|uniref:uncharacterized protein LOC127534524 n=1 Tax=Acanthochromis polyacanthus TaxID=80966 RepID=UPI002234A53B|nr:uncharacterized protein LOC127534524 [Acanthochromis polyacanthus]
MKSVGLDVFCWSFWSYAAVVVLMLFLSGNFWCSCRPQPMDCSVHMALPVFIVFLIVVWMDRSFHSVGRRLVLSSRCSFLAACCRLVVKALLVGLLWPVLVLIGGDWFVCCMNDQQLLCKPEGRTTDEEKQNLNELRNKSRMIGSFLLFAIVSVPALATTFRRGKPSIHERRTFYHRLILDQEAEVLQETLARCSRDRLRNEVENRIRAETWEESFNVAEDLIKESTRPTIPEQEP